MSSELSTSEPCGTLTCGSGLPTATSRISWLALGLVGLISGCAALPIAPSAGDVAPGPSTRIPIPPQLATPLPIETKVSPPPPANATLPQLVDYVLAHNPATQAAWAQARAAAANVGAKRSAYYPTVDAQAQIGHQQAQIGGRLPFQNSSWGPSVSLSWLVLDLGGRSGNIGEAESLLQAANLAQDATILQTLFEVEQAYYDFLSAQSLLHAEQATVDDAKKNYDAAEARREAGVATIAEVLQAKTSLSQAELNLQSAEGQVEIARGGLATAASLPPTTQFMLPELPDQLPLEKTQVQVEKLLRLAQAKRPDLARARALVEAANQHTKSVRSSGLPQIGIAGSAGRTFYFENGIAPGNNYTLQAVLKVPLFDGFKTRYDTEQAQAQADAAQAQAQGTAQQVALQVWTSYQAAQTAAKRVKAARDLLASAQQSEQVAAGRYHEGAGSVLDLLSAQSALATARAQDVQARADWLVAMAALARDTGVLDIAPEATLPAGDAR